MDVNTIRSNVKLLLGDADNATITDAEILIFINSAYREVSIITGGQPAVYTFTNADIDSNDYIQINPDLIQISSVTWNGKKIPMGNISLLEGDGLEEIQSDSVTHWFWAGANFIGFYPRPLEGITNTVKVRYNRIPTDLVNGTDEPRVSAMFHEAILYLTLARCYERIDHPMKNDAEARARQCIDRSLFLFETERGNFPHVRTAEEGWTELWR